MKDITELKRVIDIGRAAIKQAAANNDLSPFTDFQNVFYQFFGIVCGSCSDCSGGFNDSFTHAENFYNQYLINPKIIEMSESTIKIKNGGVLNTIRGTWTPADISDEVALKLIKEFPNMADSSFEKSTLPKDLEKVLESVTTFEQDAKAAQIAQQKSSAKAEVKAAPAKDEDSKTAKKK